ncbi:MAG: aromatic ring-hydroxylating oxygenase subunit alpha [Burkholderiales bacterium]
MPDTAHPLQQNSFFTEDRASGTFRLRRRAYTDTSIFELERERIFGRCWLYAGHESEIKNHGDFVSRKIGGRPVIMVRGADGAIRILLNSCTHRGVIVCRDRAGNRDVFRCPYHAWTFNNQGALTAIPGRDAYAPEFRMDDLGLREVRHTNYRGLIFLCFSSETESLEDYLAGAKEQLDLIIDQGDDGKNVSQNHAGGLTVLAGAHEYGINANWKMLPENTLDVYHLFSTHSRFMNDYMPRIAGAQPTRKQFEQGVSIPLGNGHSVLEMPMFGKIIDEHKRGDWEKRFGKIRADKMLGCRRQLLIFPNTIYIEAWQAMRTCFPAAADRMEISAWALMPEVDDPAIRQKRVENYMAFLGPGGYSTPDDVEVLELCQESFRSMPDGPPLDMSRGLGREHPAPDQEQQMRVFWRRWYELVGAEVEQRDAANTSPAMGSGAAPTAP